MLVAERLARPNDPGFAKWLRAQAHPDTITPFDVPANGTFTVAGEWASSNPKVSVRCRRIGDQPQIYVDLIVTDLLSGCLWHLIDVDMRPVFVRVSDIYHDYNVLLFPTLDPSVQTTEFKNWQTNLQEWYRIKALGISNPNPTYSSPAYKLALLLLKGGNVATAQETAALLQIAGFHTAISLEATRPLVNGVPEEDFATVISQTRILLQHRALLKSE